MYKAFVPGLSTPSLHRKLYVLAGPTLGHLTALPIERMVPVQPNPWNKYCAGNDCDPNRVCINYAD